MLCRRWIQTPLFGSAAAAIEHGSVDPDAMHHFLGKLYFSHNLGRKQPIRIIAGDVSSQGYTGRSEYFLSCHSGHSPRGTAPSAL
jgi:hypothetical protein